MRSLCILENIMLALLGSLLYMLSITIYIKGHLGLTLDVHHEIILTLWVCLILLLFFILEAFEKRTPIWWIRVIK